ncbi:putative membrane protein [Acanthamoeba castellanii mamavirus]|nr:putative membrane protein [Acanthamoeba castellanii mamavirus]
MLYQIDLLTDLLPNLPLDQIIYPLPVNQELLVMMMILPQTIIHIQSMIISMIQQLIRIL